MASAYTPAQLSQYLSYINIPSPYDMESKPAKDLSFLTALTTHQLSTIPYENLALHYSQDHTISLDPQHLFRKIVGNARGRGGYCMENSLFFTQILKGLGFNAYPVGVRIRPRVDGVPQGEYMGWVHIVNIVTLPDTTRWMIDVAFGGDGASKPLPLIDGRITRNIGAQDIRLVRDFIPGQTNHCSDERKLWVYQYRNGPEKDWNSFFAFSDAVEFLPADFHVMNTYTGGHAESFQTFTVLVVKFLRRPKGNGSEGGEGNKEEEIYGKRMLVDGVVKENLGGRTKVVHVCECEQERVEALRGWFGIKLTAEEREGIKGWRTELKGRADTG